MTYLDSLKEDLAQQAFGRSLESSRSQGLCISCGKLALERCYSDRGREEFRISGLCERCFDSMFEPKE